MTNILNTVARQVGKFVPSNPTQYIACKSQGGYPMKLRCATI